MHDDELVIQQIISAFAGVEYPGDWCLRGSNEGNEPYLVEEAFKGKDDWHALDPKFDSARHKFAIFTCEEARAIVAYLILKRESDDFERDRIDQALSCYWNERAG